jgi:hypothetical protein
MKHEAKQANGGSVPILKDGIKALEDAAAKRDVAGFGKAAEAMDWSGHPPEDFIRAMDLALESRSADDCAAHLGEGRSALPSHATIQKYARILAPAKILRSDLPSDPQAQANWRWYREHGDQYRGRWVMVKNGELLDSAESSKNSLPVNRSKWCLYHPGPITMLALDGAQEVLYDIQLQALAITSTPP